mgnify:FL=1
MRINRGIGAPPAEAEFSMVTFLFANPTRSIDPIECTLKVLKAECSAEMVVVNHRPTGKFRKCRFQFCWGELGRTDLAWRT